jgi:bifunctional DNA primase/polymerase-like protein/AAA domain-containing protein/primase-like protein
MKEADSLLDAALQYAAWRWRVFPLHTPSPGGGCSCGRPTCTDQGKHPRTRNGCHDASTEEARIHQWWTMAPVANIGIACGQTSGIWVLDIDGEEGAESLRELERKHGHLPPAPVCLTGGGGAHVYFRYSTGIVNQAKARPGLDWRTDGGYVVAPPSLHRSGRPYDWEVSAHPEDVSLREAPDWLLDIARKPRRKFTASAPSAPPIPERIKSGGRNSTLTSLAGSMRRRGMTEAAICAALIVANDEQCEPPLPLAEVRKIARNVARYEPAARAAPSGDTQTTTPNDDGPPATLTDEGADALVARELAEPQWIVEGLLVEGASMLVGHAKLGKSFMALDFAVAVARGTPALGSVPAQQGKVLYVACEDGPRRIRKRLIALAGDDVEGLEFLRLCYGPLTLDGAGFLTLNQWLVESGGVRLVIIDTLNAVRPPHTRNGDLVKEDYTLIERLKALCAQYECAVLIIHHRAKTQAGGDLVNAGAGTHGLAGAVDTSLVFERARGEHEAVLHLFGRDVEELRHYLQRNTKTGFWTLAGSGDEFMRTAERQAIFEVLKVAATALKPSQVAAVLGKPANSIKQTMRRMATDREIINLGDGHYTIPIQH